MHPAGSRSGRRPDREAARRSLRSASEVNQAIFFAAGIIIAGFVPLFTLSGVEGHIFGPMAKTYAYAIAGGLIATFTISPALSALLLPERVSEIETVHRAWLAPRLRPVLEFAVCQPHCHPRRCRGPPWLSQCSACGRSGSNFCPISRKAICGSAPRCRRRSRSRRRPPTSTACGRSSGAFPKS